EVLALCLDRPLVDVIIGNIEGAREPGNPDREWVPVLAVQTRAQSKQVSQQHTLGTPEIISQDVTPIQMSKAQEDDPTLKRVRQLCNSEEVKGKASFFRKNDLLYRKFSSPKVENGKVFTQLVVPQQYRKMVMKRAHESVLAGHLAIKRTIHKVLAEFFWPGVCSDIKRFCQSCDICQRTIPKGEIIKAPLDEMPRVDIQVRREAMDVVRPLKSCTPNNYKYIHILLLFVLLFAYREAPQENLGLSPCETQYGWSECGSMKQFRSREVENGISNIYQYVLELRERLQSTVNLIQDNLLKMSRKYKHYYDRQARTRKLKVGDETNFTPYQDK
ncbi:MAG: integrase zinc binding domain-containing protein, partial [Candidatus Thiodiazotropha sp.]